MLMALVGRSFGRARGLLIALGGVLVLFQVLLVVAAAYFEESSAFTQIAAFMPAVVQQMVGTAVFASFRGAVSFGYFHPIVIVTFIAAAIYLGSEPAADVESGMVDVLLARPVRRGQIISRSLVATATGTAGLALLMFLASRAAIAVFAPAGSQPPSASTLLRLDGNLLAVAWVFGALSLALAAAVRRRAVAAGSAGIAALVLYLLNFLSSVWPKARPYGALSPFHYYDAMPIVSGHPAHWGADLVVLASIFAALCGVAFLGFSRRDL